MSRARLKNGSLLIVYSVDPAEVLLAIDHSSAVLHVLWQICYSDAVPRVPWRIGRTVVSLLVLSPTAYIAALFHAPWRTSSSDCTRRAVADAAPVSRR
jgi:hypothetical protein